MPKCGVCNLYVSNYGYLKQHVRGSKLCRTTLERRLANKVQDNSDEPTDEDEFTFQAGNAAHMDPNASLPPPNPHTPVLDHNVTDGLDNAAPSDNQNTAMDMDDTNGSHGHSDPDSEHNFVENFPANMRAGHPIA
ncbi:hypothetical protein SISNIDRAFT_491482 [Sistotremastrum niveocremeum HHB9708]|uniref:Uncharacterized protein n=1 Tax=Sistotremastrum niveocremeum HHB9708 TaxID=1314777 RepID=A0A164MS05_9AGAM|nr:hypothetical protein SISNIDRAFT_491482 [Sistotremastrum niveocremeum HHB9708]